MTYNTDNSMNVTDIIQEAIAAKRTRFAFELLPPLKGDGMGRQKYPLSGHRSPPPATGT